MSEYIGEHKGMVIFLSVVAVFAVIIAVVQPEPLPSISKQIQVSLRMWEMGMEVTDINDNPIGREIALMLNETNLGNETIYSSSTKVVVKNTGQLPVNLTVTIDGHEYGYTDSETGEYFEGWFLDKNGKFNWQESCVTVLYNYEGQAINVGDSEEITFLCESRSKLPQIVFDLRITANLVEEST